MTPLRLPRLKGVVPLAAVAIAVALLIAGVALALNNERIYQTQKRQELAVQARILASIVTAALAFNDHDAAQEYVNALQANPEIEAAAIYDAAGSLFVSYRRASALPLPTTVQARLPSVESDRLVVLEKVSQGETALGMAYLQTSTEPLAQRIGRYGILTLLVTMASLVVTVLGLAQAALTRANAGLQQQARDLAEVNRSLQAEMEERSKAQEALRRAQRMEAVGQLTAGVAHDFNNLLTAVLGNLELLARQRGDERSQRLVTAASRAAQRGAQLTGQLLAFARRQRLAREPVDLNRLVQGMKPMLRSTLGPAIAIEVALAPELPPALADPAQLELMVLNLAINARDAMPQGGTLTIATAQARVGEPTRPEEPPPGDYVVLAVRDTGSGIASEVLDRAFEPFFTTKEVGKGSGLGLPQVLGVAQQLGGGVRVSTRIGQGTAVEIHLPRAPAGEIATPEITVAATAFGRSGPALRVLLVDDDADVRAVAAAMLSESGHEVIETADGPAAIEALARERGRINLLVVDFAMPGMDGVEVAREARRLSPGVPVVFVTGYAEAAGLSAYASSEDILQKPFGPADLAAKIAGALERARPPGTEPG